MPHQDKDDLRTPLQELKSLFSALPADELDDVERHGNAVIGGCALAMTALAAFAWSQEDALSERFSKARDAVSRICGSTPIALSRQGLFAALAACGEALLRLVRVAMIARLEQQSCWLLLGRPTFAVDGSQFAVPRTKKNLQHFAAASRKSKAAYKKKADRSKAMTTQIAVSLCLHLGSGLPFAWNRGGSADSERSLLLSTLDVLPPGARLAMDAYYFGYNFWNELIARRFTFVVRAGKNIDLLKVFTQTGKVKLRDGLVFYWPQTAIDLGGPPIVLRVAEVLVGRKRMFLLTNELELSDAQLATIYSARWGVEVFFRLVKQNCERAKLRSRTPKNVKIELDWTLLGIWMALSEAGQCIDGGAKLSPIRVLRVIRDLLLDVARYSANRVNVRRELSQCVAADESNRKSDKNSKDYPRKKKKRETGEPTIKPLPSPLQKIAARMLK